MGTLERMRYKESAYEQRDKGRGKEHNDNTPNERHSEGIADEQAV
jgi:hypothetical protein